MHMRSQITWVTAQFCLGKGPCHISLAFENPRLCGSTRCVATSNLVALTNC